MNYLIRDKITFGLFCSIFSFVLRLSESQSSCKSAENMRSKMLLIFIIAVLYLIALVFFILHCQASSPSSPL